VYLDGNEISYTVQGASFGFQSAGNYMLGSSNTGPFLGSGFMGTFYRLVSYPTQLPAAAILAASRTIQTEVASRGVPVQPVPVNLAAPQLLAAGTSITAALGLSPSQSWLQNMTLTNQPAYNIVNLGISGILVEAIDGSESNRAALMCKTSGGPSVYVISGGDNDFSMLATATPQSVFGEIAGTVQTMKQAGCRVFVGTLISRTGNGAGGTSLDSFKNSLNTLILSNAKNNGADGVIDFGANPILGADGANTNATYFQADQTHPTAVGQMLLANAASNALNYTFGYNDMNPHRVTSLPYSMAAGDGVVSVSGVTAAGSLTLPDCTGQSGAFYRITNLQSAYPVGIVPLNGSQLINGLPLATAVTVPSNGSLTLRDVPNPRTVSGCHWEM
jgi:lysophospholipase L1-like esterase